MSLTLITYVPATVEGGCFHGMLLGMEIIERLFLKQYLFCDWFKFALIRAIIAVLGNVLFYIVRNVHILGCCKVTPKWGENNGITYEK